MSVKTTNDNRPKAAITVSKMCSLLGMCRSQFYWHLKRGNFHAPLKLANGRPYYNASQVEDNLRAREIGIGVNGEYILFYERESSEAKPKATPTSKTDYSDLIDGLQSLGLAGTTNKQVADAVEHCFPNGVAGLDENDVLRTVFRHLKRSGTA